MAEKKCVLIVDDSSIIREVALDALEELSLRVTTRSTAIGLSGLVYTTRPDLVVLDVEMPGMTGTEAVERVRTACDRTKILLFSSLINIERLANECGADGWESKQYGIEGLVRTVVRMLGLRQ